MIPRRNDHRNLHTQQQFRQDVAEEPDRLGRWHRPVVDVAGRQQRVNSGAARELDELAQDVFLAPREVDLVEQAVEVPAGGVQKAHALQTGARGAA